MQAGMVHNHAPLLCSFLLTTLRCRTLNTLLLTANVYAFLAEAAPALFSLRTSVCLTHRANSSPIRRTRLTWICAAVAARRARRPETFWAILLKARPFSVRNHAAAAVASFNRRCAATKRKVDHAWKTVRRLARVLANASACSLEFSAMEARDHTRHTATERNKRRICTPSVPACEFWWIHVQKCRRTSGANHSLTALSKRLSANNRLEIKQNTCY